MIARRRLLQATTIVGLTVLFTGGAYAQQPAPEAGNRQNQRARGQRQNPFLTAVNRLDLTAEQKSKITALTDKFQADVRALRGPNADREQTRAKTTELTQKLRTDVEAVLTQPQKDKLREEMRANNRPGAGMFGRMLQELDLTAEQKTKIDPIVKEATDQMAKLRADQSTDRQGRAQKMRSIQQETLAKIRPILTDAQRTKLDAMPQGGQGGGRRANTPGAAGGA